MLTLPKFVRYRGEVYRRMVLANDEYASPQDAELYKQQVEAAIAALGGHRTGQQIGGYTKLRDGGEPWSTELVAPVAKLQPSSDIKMVLPYNTIDWCGWVEASLRGGTLTISATGHLSLDGLCFDDAAHVLSNQDVIVGNWDGSKWSWRRDLRG